MPKRYAWLRPMVGAEMCRPKHGAPSCVCTSAANPDVRLRPAKRRMIRWVDPPGSGRRRRSHAGPRYGGRVPMAHAPGVRRSGAVVPGVTHPGGRGDCLRRQARLTASKCCTASRSDPDRRRNARHPRPGSSDPVRRRPLPYCGRAIPPRWPSTAFVEVVIGHVRPLDHGKSECGQRHSRTALELAH